MNEEIRFLKYADAGYGQTGYAEKAPEDEGHAACVDLLRYLPIYWHEYPEMVALQRSLGCQVGQLLGRWKDIAVQRFSDSASWGLSLWENDYGLSVDSEKSDAFRRERIKAKARGSGTTTVQAIVNLASAFAGGEAKVLEYPSEYRFVIQFAGVKGIPANMQDLTAAIEEIKPAHLSYSFAYTYNWWEGIRGKRWNDLRPYSWEQVKII